MPAWFWLNIPLSVLFFVAVAEVPLWMVLTRPDRGPTPDRPTSQGERAGRESDLVGRREVQRV